MALQDLTPQLRTRLNRMERAVGWFVLVATVLLVGGLAYYVYQTAQRKGWFIPKFTYQTSLNNAAGLKVGDSVRLMGFPAGTITRIEPNDPKDYYGVTVSFEIIKPHYGYIWDDSLVKVSSEILGNRYLEVTKGNSGVATIAEDTNRVATAMLRWKLVEAARLEAITAVTNAHPQLAETNQAMFAETVVAKLKEITAAKKSTYYTSLTAVYWIKPAETAALNERLERLANQIEQALPNILNLTNKIGAVLENTAALASNFNAVAIDARPAVSNLTQLAAELRGPGALGEWALGTNGQQSLEATLANANQTVANTDTNLSALFENLAQSLESLAGITSNLNAQVQANTNILSSISQAVVDADDLVQGLKRHWLLRSAFKKKGDAKPVTPVVSPRDGGR